ncbi:MAG TPA: ABC transporter substrate-binding protein [Streptosporangiaceae bacterium]|nr:ABC transporter substrate-binding protein [Streptosporangiaceae bacterium]
MRRKRTLALTAALCAAGLVAAGCASSGSTGGTTGGGSGKPLIISDVTGQNWTCEFNPFNFAAWPQGGPAETGVIYEPLMFENLLTQKVSPWLATSYQWTNGLKTLTFTIRKGVKFSDGVPMTPADVAFTFNLINRNPALDGWGLWQNVHGPLQSVAVQGDNVVLNFSSPAPTYFYYAAGQVPIVPEHIWSKLPLKTLPTYPDKDPIGTGAYVVGRCNPSNLIYTANPHYWQPGKPAVKTVEWPTYLSNTPGNQCLIDGQCQWGGQYIPNISTAYLAKNSAFHNWAPSIVSVVLVFNHKLTNSPLANVKVRQAMALAINRDQVGAIGETGNETGAFQDGIALSYRQEGWVDSSLAKSYFNDYAYNPTEAVKLLEQAGYTKVVGGVRENSAGQKLSFALTNNGGYSDWVADATVIAQQLSKVGIQITQRNLNDPTTSENNGTYQIGLADQTGGPGPEYEFRQWLYGPNIGSTNYTQWNDPATNALFNEYAVTNSPAVQHSIVNKLQQLMLSQVPYIPVLGAVSWDQYSTSEFTGWPTAQNPYAQGQTAYPDWGWDLLHIKPVS